MVLAKLMMDVNKCSLYLNVFAPTSASADSKLPVKIFVYGGSFVVGGTSDPLYNGCNTATDAIVVTVAYRLGPLGFLALEGTNIAGNQAIQDVVMGAQWVQDNIAAFGGDPVRETLFNLKSSPFNRLIKVVPHRKTFCSLENLPARL